MAKLKKRSSKGAAPKLEEASNNMGGGVKENIKSVNFKLPESFIKEFKQLALDKDLSLTDLFKQSFYHYKANG